MTDCFGLLKISTKDVERIKKGHLFAIERTLPKDVESLCNMPTARSFRRHSLIVVGIFADCHFGLIESNSVLGAGRDAVKQAGRYFYEDWWLVTPNGEKPEELQKDPRNKELQWSSIFLQSSLIALSMGQLDEMSRLSEWPEAWMQLDLSDDDPLWGKILVSVAASFRKSPMPGLAEAEAEVLKARSKGPRLLMQAWIAARSGDQSAFDKALINSVIQFEKTLRSPHCSEDFLALYPSLILAAAREKGMVVPEMEPRIRARLMTPESLGFAKTY